MGDPIEGQWRGGVHRRGLRSKSLQFEDVAADEGNALVTSSRGLFGNTRGSAHCYSFGHVSACGTEPNHGSTISLLVRQLIAVCLGVLLGTNWSLL
jgi:hypothetical protein